MLQRNINGWQARLFRWPAPRDITKAPEPADEARDIEGSAD